ncbi:MAG: colanic acid biosynthesis glycosyltransferase WcaI [Chloroflexi bacterium]|nr:MAG: colanic acid biosynthesis glycosyltransferase WcaI [Chloroflexota bacterium]
MRLLIAGMNYRPEATGIGPYTTGLAEHLAGLGHDVVVSTTYPHYPHWRWQTGAHPPVERRNGVEVRRGRVVLPRRRSLGWRVLYDSSLAGVTVANAFGLRPADLVLCVSPPIQVAFAGALVARSWRAPLVLLVQDLPLDAALSVGMLRPGAAHRAGRWLERRAYALAHRIVVISRRFEPSLSQQGVPDGKVVEIPGWADLERVRPRPAEPDVRALLGATGDDLVVLHAGSMGAKQALDSAVRAARLAMDDSVRLALVGDGPERPGLEALAGGAVRLLPLQPDAVFVRMLAAADVLLLSQRADVRDSVAPSKLLTYMAAGRPVVAAAHPGSAAAHLVREAGCGVVVAPEDPEALAAALRGLRRDADRRRELGRAGRRFAEARFDRGRVLAHWESLLALVRQAHS